MAVAHSLIFKENCTKCSRLAEFLKSSKQKYPNYRCKPVAAFGDPNARLLIVGLAPGLHGANATGRPFTGDYAGVLLYETLHKFKFATHSVSKSRDDSLKLKDCRITNAVKCVPPANKPTTDEIKICNSYLQNELRLLTPGCVILALGKIAHDAVIRAFNLRLSKYPFGHGNLYKLENQLHLLDSYHCSRYNTQTKRLTQKQFEAIFVQAKSILKNS